MGYPLTTVPLCESCRWLSKNLTCKAFPFGVPQQVLLNEVDHTQPIDGDGGIQYEPLE